jgi:hypothetical protein
VLRTRGALVAHLVAESCPTTTHYIQFLRKLLESNADGDLDATRFAQELGSAFPNQHAWLDPFFNTTDLPDFRITEHGPDDRQPGQDRYRVEVENRGDVAAYIDVATFTDRGQPLRSYRQYVEPGQKRGVIFRDAARVARIELDPRGTLPQSAVEDEVVERQGEVTVAAAPYIPAYPFWTRSADLYRVDDLDLDLPSVSIRNFQGQIQWWETHHGPSGAVLLGEAEIVLRPEGAHAESFRKQMHKDELSFTASDLWIRFPPEAWDRIEPHIGENMGNALGLRRRQVYEHSFPTYFFEGSLAQVPPPGSALVVFGLSGDERRGWVRLPHPDGRVTERLWDHLRGQTIWEDTR